MYGSLVEVSITKIRTHFQLHVGNCLSIDTNKTVSITGALDVQSPAYIKELTVEQRIYGNILNVSGTVEDNGIITARSTSSWGNIRCVPSVDGKESAISFFKSYDQRIIGTGDVWMIGRNLFNANTDNFSIATNNVGNCLSIDLFGNTTLKGRLEMTDIIHSPQMTDIGNRLNNVACQVNTLTTNLTSTQYFISFIIWRSNTML